MTENPSGIRGAAPVGLVQDLTPDEALCIRYLRLWWAGPEAQAEIWNEFSRSLGPTRAKQAFSAFESVFAICSSHGRRPFILNCVNCKSLGGDESGFVNFLGYAVEGQREDAFLMACNFVRPEVALILLNFAMDLALNLRLIALNIGVVQAQPPLCKHWH
jgi:hypothetical protein